MHEAAWPAEQHDLERIVELAAAVRSEIAEERGGDLWQLADTEPVDTDQVKRWLGDDAVHVVVGGIDGVVLGFTVVRAVALRDGTQLGVVEELYVEPGARAVGVGEELLGEVARWCVARGCRGIDATALPGQRATKNFFEGSGFTTRRLIMHHRLDATAGDTTTGDSGAGDHE